MHKVVVIGCGPIGLTTACMIQEKLSNVKVIIYTENESPSTTGDISAGFWTPVYTENTPTEHVIRWSQRTLKHLVDLWKSGKAKESGLSLVPVLMLSEEPYFSVPEWTKITIGYKQLSSKAIQSYCTEFQKNFTVASLNTGWTRTSTPSYPQPMYTLFVCAFNGLIQKLVEETKEGLDEVTVRKYLGISDVQVLRKCEY